MKWWLREELLRKIDRWGDRNSEDSKILFNWACSTVMTCLVTFATFIIILSLSFLVIGCTSSSPLLQTDELDL